MPEKDFTVNYRGNDSGFGATTARVASQLRQLGAQAGGLAGKELVSLQQRIAGIFTLGFLESKIEQVMEFADSMRSLSDMTQIGVESLQELEYAARQAGTPFQAVIAAIRNLDRSRVSALSGNKSDMASFERLGISMEDMKRLSAEQMFRQIAGSINQGNYSAMQLNDTLNLMGRSASQLFPLFNAGLQELSDKAKSAGVIIKEDVINSMDQMGDQIDEMNSRFKATLAMVIGPLIEGWNKVARAVEVGYGFYGALFAAWSGEKERLDKIVSTKGWMAAKEAYPEALKNAFKMAFDDTQENYNRLLGEMDATAKIKGNANDEIEFAAERAQRAAELKAKNDEKFRENQLKGMSVEERINALLKERLELTDALAQAKDDLAREEIRTKLLDVESKIGDASSLKTQAPQVQKYSQRNLDELSRAGFFTGGRPTEMADLAREQIKGIRDVVRSIERVPAELDSVLG